MRCRRPRQRARPPRGRADVHYRARRARLSRGSSSSVRRPARRSSTPSCGARSRSRRPRTAPARRLGVVHEQVEPRVVLGDVGVHARGASACVRSVATRWHAPLRSAQRAPAGAPHGVRRAPARLRLAGEEPGRASPMPLEGCDEEYGRADREGNCAAMNHLAVECSHCVSYGCSAVSLSQILENMSAPATTDLPGRPRRESARRSPCSATCLRATTCCRLPELLAGPPLAARARSRRRADERGRVLDVATGTGMVAAELLRRCDCSVVGVDQSRRCWTPRVRVSRASPPRVSNSSRPGRGASVRPGQLRRPDVHLSAALRRRSAATMRELARVLAPGGRIASLEFGVPPWPPARAAWRLYTGVGLPRSAGSTHVRGRRSGAFSARASGASTSATPSRGSSPTGSRPAARGDGQAHEPRRRRRHERAEGLRRRWARRTSGPPSTPSAAGAPETC